MIGPAVAGALIAAVGSGWVFLINAASFGAVLCSLCSAAGRRTASARGRAAREPGSLKGFRYVWMRPDLRAVLFMLFLDRHFGLNFPIFISTMSVTAFHAGAGQIRRPELDHGDRNRHRRAARRSTGKAQCRAAARGGRTIFGLGCALAAMMPNYWLFGLATHPHRRVRPDLHHLNEQPGATIDRAGDAGASRGDLALPSFWVAHPSARPLSVG
jgi:hypothetical protein